MANIKPNLYFFGDSFVQWPEPELHWTERFSNEYNVHRLGSNGSSIEGTIMQLGTLPEYQQGDRVVVVLTEFARNSKWIYGEDYSEFVDCMGAERGGKTRKTTPFVEALIRTLAIRLDMFERRFEGKFLGQDNPGQWFNMLGRLYSLLGDFKPVYLTWNVETKKLSTLPDDMLTCIPIGSYTTVSEERGEDAHVDYHPGKEGGLVWYNICNELLSNWKPIPFTPQNIGSAYFFDKKLIL